MRDTSLHLLCLCPGGNGQFVLRIQECRFQQRGEDVSRGVRRDASVLICLYSSTLHTKGFSWLPLLAMKLA